MSKSKQRYFLLNDRNQAVSVGVTAEEAIAKAYKALGPVVHGLAVVKEIGAVNVDARLGPIPRPEPVEGDAPVVELKFTKYVDKFHIFNGRDTSICGAAFIYRRNNEEVTKKSNEVHSDEFCSHCAKLTNDRSDIQLYDKVV